MAVKVPIGPLFIVVYRTNDRTFTTYTILHLVINDIAWKCFTVNMFYTFMLLINLYFCSNGMFANKIYNNTTRKEKTITYSFLYITIYAFFILYYMINYILLVLNDNIYLKQLTFYWKYLREYLYKCFFHLGENNEHNSRTRRDNEHALILTI